MYCHVYYKKCSYYNFKIKTADIHRLIGKDPRHYEIRIKGANLNVFQKGVTKGEFKGDVTGM